MAERAGYGAKAGAWIGYPREWIISAARNLSGKCVILMEQNV